MNNNFSFHASLLKSALFSGFALLIISCSTGGTKNVSGADVSDISTSFNRGEIRLTCDTACSGSWGSSRRKAKSLFDNELWTDLVAEVTRVGHRVDLTYFYLGRAAEGLGKFEAAYTYYRLALATDYKCAGFVNNCDALNVTVEAKAGLHRLQVNPEAINDRKKQGSLPSNEIGSDGTKDKSSGNGVSNADQGTNLVKNSDTQPADGGVHKEINSRQKQDKAENEKFKHKEVKTQQDAKSLQDKAAPEVSRGRRDQAVVRENEISYFFSQPNLEQKSNIKNAVKESMFDPYSAVFEEVTIINNKFACVGVNGKNRFGGYVGKKQAVVANVGERWLYLRSEDISHENCKSIVKDLLAKGIIPPEISR